MLDHACQTGRHPNRDRGLDAYSTPPAAVRALLKAERIPRRVWEPCCGEGNIVLTLRSAGHEVYATDIADYGCADALSGIDFLLERSAPDAVNAVITNPPYRHAEAFAHHAICLVPYVALLLRLGFLESSRRTVLLEHSGLARIHVFRNRLEFMHRGGWNGPRASSAVPFAWFLWIRGWRGPAEMHRISWERTP